MAYTVLYTKQALCKVQQNMKQNNQQARFPGQKYRLDMHEKNCMNSKQSSKQQTATSRTRDCSGTAQPQLPDDDG